MRYKFLNSTGQLFQILSGEKKDQSLIFDINTTRARKFYIMVNFEFFNQVSKRDEFGSEVTEACPACRLVVRLTHSRAAVSTSYFSYSIEVALYDLNFVRDFVNPFFDELDELQTFHNNFVSSIDNLDYTAKQLEQKFKDYVKIDKTSIFCSMVTNIL